MLINLKFKMNGNRKLLTITKQQRKVTFSLHKTLRFEDKNNKQEKCETTNIKALLSFAILRLHRRRTLVNYMANSAQDMINAIKHMPKHMHTHADMHRHFMCTGRKRNFSHTHKQTGAYKVHMYMFTYCQMHSWVFALDSFSIYECACMCALVKSFRNSHLLGQTQHLLSVLHR